MDSQTMPAAYQCYKLSPNMIKVSAHTRDLLLLLKND